MDTVAVISASGKKLMPTNSYRARRLLKSKRAVIYKYRPVFTIKLVDRTNGYTQPIEYKCDTGYQNIGISICSDTKEFVNEQRDLLKDEVKRHSDSRKYRRTRRNRLRYRKKRFDNRKGMISKDMDLLHPSAIRGTYMSVYTRSITKYSQLQKLSLRWDSLIRRY